MATGIVVVLGIIWIPIMERIGGGVLYNYLQSVQSYIAPPITSVFLLGILWKRINAPGAIATLFFGLLVGTLRIIAELNNSGEPGLWTSFAQINFAHMAIYMFIACSLICVVVSLLTPAPNEDAIKGLTFGTLSKDQKEANKNTYSMLDIVASILLVVIVISILSYFTG